LSLTRKNTCRRTTRRWQLIEERLDTSSDADRQGVWGLRYIDDLILRDRDTTEPANGELDERLYALADTTWNVVGITGATGSVKVRVAYQPFGSVQYLDSSWSNTSASACEWVHLFKCVQCDYLAGVVYFRNRNYSPVCGRWMNPDPLGPHSDSANLYLAFLNRPQLASDPFGLKCCGPNVTEWFDEEISRFSKAAEDAYQVFHRKRANPLETPGQTARRWKELLDVFRYLSRLADYKSRNAKDIEPFDYSKCNDPDKNTVTLCGMCVGTNQLGNIIFGIIAKRMRIHKEARAFGRGERNDNIIYKRLKIVQKTPWTEEGQSHREYAFVAGVNFEESRIREMNKYEDICELIKEAMNKHEVSFSGPQATGKTPCEAKHQGPNTDMTREPLTGPGGEVVD